MCRFSAGVPHKNNLMIMKRRSISILSDAIDREAVFRNKGGPSPLFRISRNTIELYMFPHASSRAWQADVGTNVFSLSGWAIANVQKQKHIICRAVACIRCRKRIFTIRVGNRRFANKRKRKQQHIHLLSAWHSDVATKVLS